MPVPMKYLLVALVVVIIVVGALGFIILRPAVQPQEVVVVRFSGWGAGETEVRNYEKAIKDFQEKYPNIVVKYEPIAQMFHENILAAFPAGAASDVFYVDSSWAPIFIARGVLKPIDDIEADITKLKAEYYKFLLHPFIGGDGKLYGLPKDWSMLFLAYNKDCLERAKLVTVPDNWREFLEALETVTDKVGKPALVDHYHYRTFIALALAHGAPYPDFTSERSVRNWFNDKAVRGALKDYVDLYLNGYIKRVDAGKIPYVVLPRDVDAGWGGEAFGRQLACFTLEGSWMIPFINDQFPHFKYGERWDITVLPKGPGGRYTLGFTVILGINSRSAHAKEAYEFAKYIAGSKGQEFLVVKLGHTLPSIKGLATHPGLWSAHKKTLETVGQYNDLYVWPVMKSDKPGIIISTIDSILISYIASMKETKTYSLDALLNDLVNAIITAIKS